VSAGRVVPVELVCLDMAGTTVTDDGAVEEAFVGAIESVGDYGAKESAELLAYVRDTMGTSKITVFRALLGDERVAAAANVAFERAYHAIVAAGRVSPIPGATEAIGALREAGHKVALLTGFSAGTRDEIIEVLGWRDLVDLALCPSDARRGRPYPDLVLTAVLRLGIDDVAAVAVAGDTAADVLSARRAGAAIAAGVLTGADGRERLVAAGATHVLASVADLPALLVGS